MPFYSARELRRKSKGRRRKLRYPGGKSAPIVGEAHDPPRWARTLLSPFVRNESVKRAGAMYSAFADEMDKIAYVPNTEQDKAGILRSLLVAMMGKAQFTPTGEPSTDQLAEQNLMFGGPEGRNNYAEQVQARLSERLLNQTRLEAAMNAMSGPSRRVVGR